MYVRSELADVMLNIQTTLAGGGDDWDARVDALRKLQELGMNSTFGILLTFLTFGVVASGAAELENFGYLVEQMKFVLEKQVCRRICFV